MPKKRRWNNATHELALFMVKPYHDSVGSNFRSYEFDSLIDDYEKTAYDEVNDTDNEDHDLKQSFKLNETNRVRHKKFHKRLKLKYLLKNNDIESLLAKSLAKNGLTKTLDLSSTSFIKGSSKIHIKHHVYTQLKPYLDSFNNYSSKKAYTRSLNNDEIVYLKNVPSRWIDVPSKKSKKFTKNLSDQPVLVEFTLHHSQVSDEMKNNYDSMYLEFLMSLQHRDISPEDYEYLSRLDELIKKNTLNEKTLKQLKTERVNDDLLLSIEHEICTICMDAYSLNEIRKHLPCNHVFHETCINTWLKENSNKCPLDQILIEA